MSSPAFTDEEIEGQTGGEVLKPLGHAWPLTANPLVLPLLPGATLMLRGLTEGTSGGVGLWWGRPDGRAGETNIVVALFK